jgi:hypothetical protein
MKRILISAVLALALAGTSAFAAQNKNAAKKPAAKPANTAMASNTGTMKAKPKAKRKRKAKAKAAASNSNTGGTMKPKAKAKNKNS